MKYKKNIFLARGRAFRASACALSALRHSMAVHLSHRLSFRLRVASYYEKHTAPGRTWASLHKLSTNTKAAVKCNRTPSKNTKR